MTMQNAFMSVRPRVASTSASPRLANAQLLRGMSQPPHFGRVGVRDESIRDYAAAAVCSAHKEAQFARVEKIARSRNKKAVVKV